MNAHHVNGCPFVVHGYFEELLEPETGYLFGTRRIENPDRPLGSPGRVEYALHENVILSRGFKKVILKATPAAPVRVVSMIQILCGRKL